MNDRLYRLFAGDGSHINVRGLTKFVSASTSPGGAIISIDGHRYFWDGNDRPPGREEFSLKLNIESIFARKIDTFHHQWLGINCLVEMDGEWLPCTLILFQRPIEKESCPLCPSPKGTWLLMTSEAFCGLGRSSADVQYLRGEYGE